MLNIIAGFQSATRGRVLIDGAPVVRPDRRRIFIFQENGGCPWLTVETRAPCVVRAGTRSKP